MPQIGTLTSFTASTTILSGDVNSNFNAIKTAVNTYAVWRDVATTISAAHTFSGLQTFTAGVTLSGSSNLSVAGTSTLTGNVTIGGTLGVTGAITGTLTGNVTGDLTGTASTATALATARTIGMSGDVTASGVSFDGTGNITLTAAITSGVIVNADVNAAAAIAYSKLNLATSIVNGDISASAAIAYSKLALTGAILNADLAGSIADSKLSTISTAGKVSNSATTASSSNTASAIVARDGSGNFAAGAITAASLVVTGTTTINGVAYTWPGADGTSGYVLQTNGAGTLSWVAQSGGGGISGLSTNYVPVATGSTTIANSIIQIASGVVKFGTNPAASGILAIPNNSWIAGRNAANSADVNVIRVTSSNSINIGSTSIVATTSGDLTVSTLTVSSTITLNGIGYTFPVSGGTSGYVLSTNGSGTLSWIAASGGVSGSGTTGTIPKWSSSTGLGDSIITISGTTATISNIVNAVTQYNVNGTKVVGSRVTGFSPTFDGTASKTASMSGLANPPSTIDGAAPIGPVQALETLVRSMYDALVAHGLIGA